MRKVVTFNIGLIFILSLFFPQVSHASDIDNHWAKYDIQELVDRKIMSGTGNGIYSPNKNITRAEFTQLVLFALDVKADTGHNPFQDVPKNKWYYDSILTAYNIGLISGTSATAFSPEKAVSRQDISVIIARALSMKNIHSIESSQLFIDERTISSYARPAVKQLQHLGVVSGKVKGSNNNYYFKPLDLSTRAEAATMLVRMLKTMENPNEIIRQVTYNYDFKHMVNKQMGSSSRPQTDYNGPWYDASQAMVEYYTNPNNFRYLDTDIYQFLVLSGSSGVSAQKLNGQVLLNKGILHGTADAFIRASKAHNVNDVYLISHALLETGNGTSKLATGIEVGLNKDNKATMVTAQNRSQLTAIKKTYNMFGIGAYDHCPNDCGAARAYEQGWFTVDDAILGGAAFISADYIGAGQDTIYKMRWNPDNPATHQYATDVGWAKKQTTRIKAMFEMINDLDGHPLVFEIPTFKNQPKLSALPSGEARFNVDRKLAGEKAFVKVGNAYTLAGPHTSFAKVGNALKNGDAITIIGQNKNWYKVKTASADGWIQATHLNLTNGKKEIVSEASVQQETRLGTGMINHNFVPVYNDPAMKSEIIVELNVGTEVVITNEHAHTYEVSVNDGTSTVTGWVHKPSIDTSFEDSQQES